MKKEGKSVLIFKVIKTCITDNCIKNIRIAIKEEECGSKTRNKKPCRSNKAMKYFKKMRNHFYSFSQSVAAFSIYLRKDRLKF